MMEEANETADKTLHKVAQSIFDQAFEKGWDKEYEGLLYFIDCKGMPTEAYEHDMKLWWPHTELLIASMMLYRDLRDEKYLNIFSLATRNMVSGMVTCAGMGSRQCPAPRGLHLKGPFISFACWPWWTA